MGVGGGVYCCVLAIYLFGYGWWLVSFWLYIGMDGMGWVGSDGFGIYVDLLASISPFLSSSLTLLGMDRVIAGRTMGGGSLG